MFLMGKDESAVVPGKCWVTSTRSHNPNQWWWRLMKPHCANRPQFVNPPKVQISHYNNVIISLMASQITWVSSRVNRLFRGTSKKTWNFYGIWNYRQFDHLFNGTKWTILVPGYWPIVGLLWGVDGGFPPQRGQRCGRRVHVITRLMTKLSLYVKENWVYHFQASPLHTHNQQPESWYLVKYRVVKYRDVVSAVYRCRFTSTGNLAVKISWS